MQLKLYLKIQATLALLLCQSVMVASPCGKQSFVKSHVAFLEALTYPDAQWKSNDFGKMATAQQKALLKKYQPRVYIGPQGRAPVDFYKEYLPYCQLQGPARQGSTALTRQQLKTLERCGGNNLDYQAPGTPCRGADCAGREGSIYGRIFYETFTHGAIKPPVTVLKYSTVFVASGLPQGLTWYQSWGGRAAGDLDNWHELDIHGAVQLLFKKGASQPFVVLLAQHNNFRTYVVGEDLVWPAGGHVSIAYAQRSNEPYLLPEDGGYRQASGFW